MHDGNNPDKPPRFLAKIHKANESHQVVVKFVYNYSGTCGKDVHEYLQSLGLAPLLYSAMTGLSWRSWSTWHSRKVLGAGWK